MSAEKRPLVLVAAHARNRAIGVAGTIPWHSREDFAHFKQVTAGQTLIMGRLTHESIGRPLPGRRTVVISRNRDYRADGVEVVGSLEAALQLSAAEPFGEMDVVAGGAQIYALALPLADRQVLTEVDVEVHGDAFYPVFDAVQWRVERREEHPELSPALTFTWWERT